MHKLLLVTLFGKNTLTMQNTYTAFAKLTLFENYTLVSQQAFKSCTLTLKRFMIGKFSKNINSANQLTPYDKSKKFNFAIRHFNFAVRHFFFDFRGGEFFFLS